MPIEFNKTFDQTIENVSFGNLPKDVVNEMFKDGRVFAPFAERILEQDFGLKYIPGCKAYDNEDAADSNIKYDQKTFTKGGCKFMPSSMIGTGRKFDQGIFNEKVKNMNYAIVSNVNFPHIRIRFMSGTELAAKYPKGEIKPGDHAALFGPAKDSAPHSPPT
jgi:hypothetical protein